MRSRPIILLLIPLFLLPAHACGLFSGPLPPMDAAMDETSTDFLDDGEGERPAEGPGDAAPETPDDEESADSWEEGAVEILEAVDGPPGDNGDDFAGDDAALDAGDGSDRDADAVDPGTDDAGEDPPADCNGVPLDGFCWYASGENESCNAACDAHGGCDLAGTRDFAGSNGTDEHCVAVLAALGYGSYPHQGWSNTDLGCYLAWGSWTYWSSALPTTCEAASSSASGAQAVRMCACNR